MTAQLQESPILHRFASFSEGIHKMSRKPPMLHRNNIISEDKQMRVSLPRNPVVRGGADAVLRCMTDRIDGITFTSAHFHFNKGNQISPPGDDIDFTDGRAVSHDKDSVAFQTEKDGRDVFGKAPVALRPLALLPLVVRRHRHPSTRSAAGRGPCARGRSGARPRQRPSSPACWRQVRAASRRHRRRPAHRRKPAVR